MEQKARASAAEAKRERELREKAKAFLAAEGYRHVRAAHKWSPVASYPLHRAVQCNDPEMVRLLLWMGADATKCNTFGYCKNRMSEDPCLPQLGFLDQFALDLKSQRARQPPGGPVPCTTADVCISAYQKVLSHLQEQMLQADKATCYYSSRDERGEDVWLSIPSPGLVDHAWFQSHLEYPVLMALGSLVLLTLLLGCLAVEGAELYFSGIV
ncbi:NPC1 [Symbiodinium sp. CCMP2592]|nr:NPC1 [Symbiodinium sp. CCMP2592]